MPRVSARDTTGASSKMSATDRAGCAGGVGSSALAPPASSAAPASTGGRNETIHCDGKADEQQNNSLRWHSRQAKKQSHGIRPPPTQLPFLPDTTNTNTFPFPFPAAPGATRCHCMYTVGNGRGGSGICCSFLATLGGVGALLFSPLVRFRFPAKLGRFLPAGIKYQKGEFEEHGVRDLGRKIWS